jgi:hypothetical protein
MVYLLNTITRWKPNENGSDNDWEVIAAAGALAAVVAALGIALYGTYFGPGGMADLADHAGAEIIWRLWSR